METSTVPENPYDRIITVSDVRNAAARYGFTQVSKDAANAIIESVHNMSRHLEHQMELRLINSNKRMATADILRSIAAQTPEIPKGSY